MFRILDYQRNHILIMNLSQFYYVVLEKCTFKNFRGLYNDEVNYKDNSYNMNHINIRTHYLKLKIET